MNLYMQSNVRRKNKNSDLVRTSAPYVATALLVLVLFWGVDTIKQDTNLQRQYDPAEVVQPPRLPPLNVKPARDWTHKLVTGGSATDDKKRPDDATEQSCPLPTGNWGHTCDREVTIEGPCKGKCMLKALCQDVKEKFKETTFEYDENQQVEIKNVNGLLCNIEDGRTACGVNFHGNLAALKNCVDYVPRRHEVIYDGLYAPSKGEETKKDTETNNNDWEDQKDPVDEEMSMKKKKKAYEDELEPEVKRPKRKRWEEETEDLEHGSRRGAARPDNLGDERTTKKTYEEFDEYHPAPRREPDRRPRRIVRNDDDEDYRPAKPRYREADQTDDGDDERVPRVNRRRYRPADDDDAPRRLRGMDT